MCIRDRVYVMIHLFEQCADLNILCIAGVEVINVAIEYTLSLIHI